MDFRPHRNRDRFDHCALAIALVFLFCSCATRPSPRLSASPDPPTQEEISDALPPEQPVNQDAGRGSLLIVEVQLEKGRALPMVIDTGAGCTVLDKSLEQNLGQSLGTVIMHSFLGTTTNVVFNAPRLYLGGIQLKSDNQIVTSDLRKRLSPLVHHPVLGILGIDVLENYCIQLDFPAGKIRFLDAACADKSTWGKSFPIVPVSDEDARPAIAETLLGTHGPHTLIDSGFFGDGSMTSNHFQVWTNEAVTFTKGETHVPDAVLDGKKYFFVGLRQIDWPTDAIGLNFLARHLVTFDFPHHTLYLRRQSIGPLPNPELAQFKPLPDREPKVTARIRAAMQDWLNGTARADDYTAAAWKKLQSKQKEIHTLTERLGEMGSLTLVDRSGWFSWRRRYRYQIEFANGIVVARFDLNRQDKVISGNLQVAEWKAPVD
ncbi:MAG TPA: hypothetical protein VFV81_04225 [Verrucomicrobiae bacterium]|nr:hypothetical protein [Verrucomicrobiae bacterium]